MIWKLEIAYCTSLQMFHFFRHPSLDLEPIMGKLYRTSSRERVTFKCQELHRVKRSIAVFQSKVRNFQLIQN